MTVLRPLLFTCAGIVALSIFSALLLMAGVLTPSVARSQLHQTPCYPTAQSAALVQAHKKWANLRKSQDPDFVDPLFQDTALMVEGDESTREWVMPGCVVTRNPYGQAVVLKSPPSQ